MGSYTMTPNYAQSTSAFSDVHPISIFGRSPHYSAFSNVRIEGPLQAWWAEIVRRLDDLCSLPKGWNGYNAPPVSFSNAYFALSLLNSACPSGTPKPQIVPGPNGDLQIEWRIASAEIELHVLEPYNVHAWRLWNDEPREEELGLTSDFTVVARWLKELAESQIAAQPAAA
jgi:hypothetical protein